MYFNGCGRISDFYSGYETLLCDQISHYSETCDCRENLKNNIHWHFVVLTTDLLTKRFFDLNVEHQATLYEPK